ncbi:MAG: saccharopine dehydrogenase C-terminal domain-containing protein [Candidatus Pseudobacter hemicellulosilyticus]|uniref:Saccharopine dehydrogenase C-terminal domain-containing protein n=1 Tax=Candidatus Pseudobacter hemicellulosilyticus TaxID=3121375 RepID=A0AAJ5WQG4_9BACT|nr:MAG: saccharopine dehydrogenase C-terminal domain-containing protein [Pseudobacter sp.]
MKHILVFGAGKSATCLIEYLVKQTAQRQWTLTVADGDGQLALSKTGQAPHTRALALDVHQAPERQALIATADLVISLLPPSLHFLVAQDCLLLGRHLLTASYVDSQIAALREAIAAKGLLFLCEMGLDPGIDHMSALQLIHDIRQEGGEIHSFRSHCGGLVAPESDDNPWHYKISWNPRNVVMAGKAGAIFRDHGQDQEMPYEALFNPTRTVSIPGLGELAWYPNRDSLSYGPVYGLHHTSTFIRTTLRHPDFCGGWRQLVEWGLTDETVRYHTDGQSLQAFFDQYRTPEGLPIPAVPAGSLLADQLDFLGRKDADTLINKGTCSAADVLQFALEQKLVLQPADKDMIVMLHEIGYRLNGLDYQRNSCLIVRGEDQRRTAMAKTVGLPLGIAAVLFLEGKIPLTGLHIPILPEIYTPVLQELGENGIRFRETLLTLS